MPSDFEPKCMLQGSDSKVNMSSPKLMDIHKAVDLAMRKLK